MDCRVYCLHPSSTNISQLPFSVRNAIQLRQPEFINNQCVVTCKRLVYHGLDLEIGRFCKVHTLGNVAYAKFVSFIRHPYDLNNIALVLERWEVYKMDRDLGTDIVRKQNNNSIVVIAVDHIDTICRICVGPIDNEYHILVEWD